MGNFVFCPNRAPSQLPVVEQRQRQQVPPAMPAAPTAQQPTQPAANEDTEYNADDEQTPAPPRAGAGQVHLPRIPAAADARGNGQRNRAQGAQVLVPLLRPNGPVDFFEIMIYDRVLDYFIIVNNIEAFHSQVLVCTSMKLETFTSINL